MDQVQHSGGLKTWGVSCTQLGGLLRQHPPVLSFCHRVALLSESPLLPALPARKRSPQQNTQDLRRPGPPTKSHRRPHPPTSIGQELVSRLQPKPQGKLGSVVFLSLQEKEMGLLAFCQSLPLLVSKQFYKLRLQNAI